ncbi:alpha-amylase family glycosyl hydrolase [Mycoplasmopsis felis]|uniref:alpha-amylase family glycosyl hydrolase n=2 Tax=Mycoplasmopsis felis TaxID=33923 RepID=UPI0021B0198C|nr:alpha-amylase family glycosyl hydrolase [Mycoplasmopsis felis]UWW00757.1 alpha-amylase family glycosyl hydrolase [Mycoplasmopsis felis]
MNLNNPKVLQELDYIHQFWAAKGVDCFRYDAFEHYFKSENSKKFNTNDPEKTRNLFNRWRNVVENTYKKANENNINRTDLRTLLFGEWWRDPAEPIIKDYWGQNNGISSVIDGTKWKGITNVSLNWNDEINVINSLTRDGFKHEWIFFR